MIADWGTFWPDYLPEDITPLELSPPALAGETESWIIDTAASPVEITDWDDRRRDAVVPFQVSSQGWPLNPTGRTGKAGRNLGRWGENAAVDSVVVAGAGDDRQILLIRRSDVGSWAIPGGMVDQGENTAAAVVRELAEETGADLAGVEPDTVLYRGYVDDWRASDHAWVCSTAVLYIRSGILPVAAADDAADARWWPFVGLEQLADDLVGVGGLYAAHRPILASALGYLS